MDAPQIVKRPATPALATNAREATYASPNPPTFAERHLSADRLCSARRSGWASTPPPVPSGTDPASRSGHSHLLVRLSVRPSLTLYVHELSTFSERDHG